MSVDAAVAAIQAAAPGFTPAYGLVLGSGLGVLADDVADAVRVDYGAIPGFPEAGVAGHGGTLVLGTLAGQAVACMQGRAHYYEHGQADAMKVPVRTLKALGCETLILTNAAGSLNPDAGPGSAMLITDHINFSGSHPLIGEQGNERFVSLSDVYDGATRDALKAAAERVGETLFEGVYIWFSGPSFETPAEIRASRILGADAVGMSTVPEAILARHCGLKVAAISNVTNLAAGMSDEELSHAQTMAMAEEGARKIARILRDFLAHA